MLAGFLSDKPVVLEMTTKQIFQFEFSNNLNVYVTNMGRGGLVGIATVYRMESRCARDVTRLNRMACQSTQNRL
jgi:hypothetical protein